MTEMATFDSSHARNHEHARHFSTATNKRPAWRGSLLEDRDSRDSRTRPKPHDN